ncbi:MAG: SDR family NAD(P)-dependent oxidoreductase [Candidatus Omnitrophica bacterium]|nr:SDR family NAD(P)-dependent oxidoreductase [Candidatus Omnitrophota bacterium]MBI2173820.1 SDR family NAD(P)-dependent oxidoreductase [Candidatus Omnitrophota bacterium]MBI3010239.1 SDR family NAD(P)-dependent oxidoreductase [Candidatus Omnitrophota bacterium]
MSWSNKRVLVTGANGFIGSHLIRRLIQEGAQVGVFVRPSSLMDRIADLRPQLKFFYGDLRDDKQVSEAVHQAQPEAVFHLGASGATAWDALAEEVFRVNAVGTVHLLEACLKVKPSIFLYTGSWFEYADRTTPISESAPLIPANAYAAAKSTGWLMAQLYGRERGLPVVGVRPFLVYGPGEAAGRLIPSLITAALRHETFRATKAEQVRDFIYIDDVVEGILQTAGCSQAQGQMFNLGTGQGTSVRDMIGCFRNLWSGDMDIAFGDIPYRPNEIWHAVADTRVAREILGWQAAVGVEEGLKRTVDSHVAV